MQSTDAITRRWRETLGYLNWLLNPRHGRDVTQVYDLLADRSPTEQRLYLNLGYWRSAATLDEACDALALLVAETAQMGPGDEVLDVGFGFADQDMLWARTFRPRQIIGLNVTASQVERARQRVAEAGLAGQIDLRLGSATQMPLDAGSVDKVVALECAFHFDTRERFFAEAFRVLRPGGRLVVADILPMPPAARRHERLAQRWGWRQAAGKFLIPEANAYTREVYAERLAAVGFAEVAVASIRDDVYPPLHRYLARDRAAVARLHSLLRVAVRIALRLDPGLVFSGLDYVLASAERPRAPA
ncbi:methyltransferase domain-containing protein [Thiococcus pfennigii]|uniref:methyltransferase domain-containing protein n=1 Tax=Thiococcus pfennigii TaxID=1057 RepID=UPI001908896D|nr:methyltransferase domain-containing protein [Thiococcus pfennigii]MBK1702486.1 SAM-dependent methyltransferase [Thiococcus pfennigii]MBK1733436.1 SAM-dependent methyltransferase [Thiococcus pfennigii]